MSEPACSKCGQTAIGVSDPYSPGFRWHYEDLEGRIICNLCMKKAKNIIFYSVVTGKEEKITVNSDRMVSK